MIYHTKVRLFLSIFDRMAANSEKEFLRKLGERINHFREVKGYSVSELADRADLTRAHLYLIQDGGTNPTAISLKRIADALEISVSELMSIS